MRVSSIEYRVKGEISRRAIEELFRKSWDPPAATPSLLHSLTWITAHEGGTLIGFVNVAWDGRTHAFLLDPTVAPHMRRRGIGTELVRSAVEEARGAGCEWIHVDFEPGLEAFYERCGFRKTPAGLIRLCSPGT